MLQAIPLVLGILVLTFVLIHLAPGDPIYALAGQSGDAAYYAEMRAKFGLDRSIGEQLAIYIANALHGDFGYSYTYAQPVFAVIADRIPATLLLMAPALLLSTVVGIGLGIHAAARPGGPSDHAILVGSLLGAAIPGFWLAQLLVIVFAVGLGWFPIQGMTTARGSGTGLAAALDVVRHLVLPVVTLALLQLALVTRLTRSSLREALAEDYVRASRAKGLSNAQVMLRHALPNARLPVITVVGGHFGTLLTGAVLTGLPAADGHLPGRVGERHRREPRRRRRLRSFLPGPVSAASCTTRRSPRGRHGPCEGAPQACSSNGDARIQPAIQRPERGFVGGHTGARAAPGAHQPI